MLFVKTYLDDADFKKALVNAIDKSSTQRREVFVNSQEIHEATKDGKGVAVSFPIALTCVAARDEKNATLLIYKDTAGPVVVKTPEELEKVRAQVKNQLLSIQKGIEEGTAFYDFIEGSIGVGV
jgi:hypothetical protein